MHARVATFEVDSEGGIDEMADGIRRDIESGTLPPGLDDAKGVMLLVDRPKRKALAIVLFESDEAMMRGDEALNQMSGPPTESGRRSGVDFYEVAVQRMM
jgi:hypothetical protein